MSIAMLLTFSTGINLSIARAQAAPADSNLVKWHHIATQHSVQMVAPTPVAASLDDKGGRQPKLLLAGDGAISEVAFDVAFLALGTISSSDPIEPLVNESSWKVQAIARAPVPNNGFCLAGAKDVEYGFVAAYNLDEGRFAWRSEALDAPVCKITVGEELVFVAFADGSVSALDLHTGALRWNKRLHAKMVTAMTVVGDEWLASGDWSGKLILSRQDNGEETTAFSQHRDCITHLLPIPTEHSGRRQVSLYSSSKDGTVRLWYPESRRLVRFVSIDRPIRTIALAGEGGVYAATNDGKIHLLDMLDAEIVSSIPAGQQFISSMVVLSKHLISSNGGRGIAWIPTSTFHATE